MMTKGKKVDQRIKEENENETNNIKNINGKTNLCMKNKMYCTSLLEPFSRDSQKASLP